MRAESSRRPAVLLAYGEGGHNAQMKRLLGRIASVLDLTDKQLIVVNDSEKCFVPEGAYQVILRPLRDKHVAFSVFGFFSASLSNFLSVLRVLKRHDCRLMLSTGPGIAILPALLFRLCGKHVIHIETWSRFYSKSSTGRAMYWLSNEFYVQNEELQSQFPKAEWSGRL